MTADDKDWYASGPGRTMCKGCGEDKLVDEIADGRGVRNYCKVCSREWVIHGPLTAQEYKALPR